MDGDETAYHDRIATAPNVMVGKPVVNGTRIPVAAVLRQRAVALDLREHFEAYPRSTAENVRACLAYAADLLEGEEIAPAFAPRARVASGRA